MRKYRSWVLDSSPKWWQQCQSKSWLTPFSIHGSCGAHSIPSGIIFVYSTLLSFPLITRQKHLPFLVKLFFPTEIQHSMPLLNRRSRTNQPHTTPLLDYGTMESSNPRIPETSSVWVLGLWTANGYSAVEDLEEVQLGMEITKDSVFSGCEPPTWK